MNHRINHANIKEWAKNYDGPQFDGILCDPPYELGFMGKSWDSSGIAFDQDMWADLLRILKPGGHLLAFSGSRTYHRMAVAIEDAGFEIRDMIEWVYGSGFPKSLNIGKAVDKINGEGDRLLKFVQWYRSTGMKQKQTNEIIGKTDVGSHYLRLDQPAIPTVELWGKLRPHISVNIPQWVDELVERIERERELIGKHDTDMGGLGGERLGQKGGDITKGTSPYEGYGTALKPAHEPCALARKPMIDPDIDLTETVRRAIIDTGLTEDIQWNYVSVADAEKSRQLTYLSTTHLLRTAETYARRVKSKQTTDTENDTESHYAKEQKNDTKKDQTTTSSTEKSLPSDLKTKSSTPTVTSASVVENQSEHSSRLTTLTVAVDSTEKVTTAKYIQNLGDKGFLLDTELFAGTVTGLTDLATPVLIARNSDGTYTYPKELPKIIKGGSNTVANNVLKYGTGGLNIDGSRVGTETLGGGTMPDLRDVGAMSKEASGIDKLSFGQNPRPATRKDQPTYTGRFPANLIHDGSDEVVGLFPNTAPAKPDYRTTTVSSSNVTFSNRRSPNLLSDNGGSAARFFYTAKASKSERNAGLEGFEEVRVTDGRKTEHHTGHLRTSPKVNYHPTVKPLSLTKYLANLIKPPTGGRLLVPFRAQVQR